ncbi:MAG: hypothetical protein ABI699_07235 [Caldimonas sp.]
MRWTERQQAMLREMGIRLWSGDAQAVPASAAECPGGLAVAEAPPRAAARSVPTATASPLLARDGPPQATPTAATPTAATPTAAPPAAASAHPPSGSGPWPAPTSAEWLIVGEPFEAGGEAVDPAGHGDQQRLLDNMLHAIGVARAAPGRAGRACYLPVGEGSRAALDAAIAEVRPRCILALGRVAANILLDLDEPLGRLRERSHRRSDVPVVVTFALPYLLRHPADKARAWTDLCRAAGTFD